MRTAHQNFVEGIARFRERIFTAGRDGTVKLWVGGRVEHTYETANAVGHLHEPFTAIAVSPDGKVIAAAGASGIYRWEVDSGQELSFMAKTTVDSAHTLLWIGSRLLAAYDDRLVRWSMDHPDQPQVARIPQGRAVLRVLDCNDGQHFATLETGTSGDTKIEFDVMSQRMTASQGTSMTFCRFDLDGRPAGQSTLDWINPNAALDGTGQRLAVLDGKDGVVLFALDAQGRLQRSGELHRPGCELNNLTWAGANLGLSESFGRLGYKAVLLTPEGKVLAEAPSDTYPRSLLAFESATGPALVIGQNNGLVQWVGAHPALASSGSEADPESVNPELEWLGLSPDGRRLIVQTNQGTFQPWDLTHGKPSGLLHPFGGELTVLRDQNDTRVEGGGTHALMLPDGRLLLSNLAARKSVIYDFAAHRLDPEVSCDKRLIGLDRQGQPVYSSYDVTLLEGQPVQNPTGQDTWVCSVAPCGSGYLLARRDGTLGYFDGQNVLPVPSPDAGATSPLAPTIPPQVQADPASGLLYHYQDRQLSLLAAHRGAVPQWLRQVRCSDELASMALLPGGLAVGQTDGVILVVDDQLRLTHELHGHTGAITSLLYLAPQHGRPGGARLASASQDGTVKLWDLKSARCLLTLHPLNEGHEWVATTPDGHFDGSSQGTRLLEITVNGLRYRIEQFFADYYTPGLVQRVLYPTASNAPQAVRPLEQNSRPPEVHILPSGPSPSEVWVEATDAGGGVSNVALYLNGHRLPGPAEQQGSRFRFSVSLASGANLLRATAFNAGGSVESAGDRLRLKEPKVQEVPPALHVLSCGVNRYRDPSIPKLAFARSDATSVAGLFHPGLYGKVEVVSFYDEQASHQAIVGALTALQQTRPQDALVVFLAGHGLMSQGHFAYLPVDARIDTQQSTSTSCLRSDELTTLLSRIPASRQLVVLDCCQSGGSSTDFERIRAEQKLARSSGSFLLAAAAADQSANELPSLGHGVLTYSLLEGLGQDHAPAAPLDANKRITVDGLLSYIGQEVPRLTERLQIEEQDVVLFSNTEDFPLTRP